MKLRELIAKVLRFLGFSKPCNVDYISTGEALPSPMTPEEEAKTVEEYMNGSDEARLKLIERNLRLVVYIAKRFDNTGVDLEDLISIGTLGLIEHQTCDFCVQVYRERNIDVSAQDGARAHRGKP